jgi:lipopolysaccharide export system protein LptA
MKIIKLLTHSGFQIIFIFILIAFTGNTTNSYAQQGRQEQQVRLNADRVTYNEKNREIILSGNVRFIHRDAVLTGNRAVFNTKTQTGNIRGNVKITQPGTVITADRMDVYYNKNIAQLQGNVVFITNRSPSQGASGAPERQMQTTRLTAQSLDYNWVQKSGTATCGISVVQGSRRAYGNQGNYDGNAQLVTIEGNVRFEQGSNDWLTAQRVILDMQRNVFTATGGVSGTFYIERQESQTPGAKIQKPESAPDKLPRPSLPFKENLAP